MYSYRLKITESDLNHVSSLVMADLPREAGAFLTAGVAKHNSGHDILIRRVVEIPRCYFTRQESARLELAPAAINGLVALCEASGLGAVLCHSHPDPSSYSPSDDMGERRIVRTLHEFLPRTAPTASLLIHPGGLHARLWLRGCDHPVPVSEVVVVGRSVRRESLDRSEINGRRSQNPLYERQVLAFGDQGQQAIAASRAAIVGLGGTGSPCAEQLARLGVGDIVLIDYDKIEPSNISRMYGTFARENALSKLFRQPKRKTRALARHLKRINPEIKITEICGHAAEERVARKLVDRDVVFSCTDDHWGRSILNRIAYQYLVPTINTGVRVDASGGRIVGAVGVVDLLRPGLPCLWCRQFLSAKARCSTKF